MERKVYTTKLSAAGKHCIGKAQKNHEAVTNSVDLEHEHDSQIQKLPLESVSHAGVVPLILPLYKLNRQVKEAPMPY
ncbi:hypothetical protein NEUTE1DRAFT_103882 [Neurospora tetrasperma FGSC 2508]|uniref:Uncharacterized protein n=1 Tax=Neurospora tetrasperma (strain FGSC 2508 / ATCC MYA-4615 / P0657) TaxID=510951 RepID=F8MXG3_NEUT8|nr:uncharacterized protein NEUTE1DRAFT_103882 [Neurospora tetrasperma FGSC 2508]EGO54434.1 hypothetical protein NEUTE1DRAFT_103882 [Neurospora tetrasperma FGSC 2508]EGZ68119.1 hypothetical protein NEUTE2DRAFT_132777 [Neurospora tetrasperma FGSC 2509]